MTTHHTYMVHITMPVVWVEDDFDTPEQFLNFNPTYQQILEAADQIAEGRITGIMNEVLQTTVKITNNHTGKEIKP